MKTDVLIIGGGIAGATAALELSADATRQITVLTRAADAHDSNSYYAQGGIVSCGIDDSAALLAADILEAGDGLCHRPAVEQLAEHGPRLVRELLVERAGVAFDTDSAGDTAFALEGGHSRRRILHVGDRTGQAIMIALVQQLRERPNVRLCTGRTAVDLITFPHHSRTPTDVYSPSACHGAYTLDQTSGVVEPIIAEYTMLATGGLGQVFLHTTNPAGARGDGLAMAHRAGARIINTEYVQFHPTSLHMTGPTKTLISEALRGEGGTLLTPDGEPFMDRYAADGALATRDIVARAIYTEMVTHGYSYVLLDVTSRSAAFIAERFPNATAACREQNIDITAQPIPIVPAAHYSCGGILVDERGRTTLPGLYAVGEVSCTGVHGANRLASTSLLEGLLWGAEAAADVRRRDDAIDVPESAVPAWDDSAASEDADPALIACDMQTIRNLMWHYVGVRRHGDRLDRATRELRRLWSNIEDFYRAVHLNDGLIGLHNSATSATLIARAALRNPVSCGCHFREDPAPARRPTMAPAHTAP